MTVLDLICIVIMALAIAFGTIKGFKKIVFRICAFVIAMVLAKLCGTKIGTLLLSNIIKIKNNAIETGLSEKIHSAIISTLGTLIVFFVMFFILKRIFKVVDGKIEPSLQSVIVDRVCGALAGLFLGVAFVLAFTEIVSVVFTAISSLKQDVSLFEYVDSTVIFKFIRNLN